MITDHMNGTALRSDHGVAKKAGRGVGWTVKAFHGHPFNSIRHGARTDEMTNYKFVATKREARRTLAALAALAAE